MYVAGGRDDVAKNQCQTTSPIKCSEWDVVTVSWAWGRSFRILCVGRVSLTVAINDLVIDTDWVSKVFSGNDWLASERDWGSRWERPELSVCLTVHPKCGWNFGALLVIKKRAKLSNYEIWKYWEAMMERLLTRSKVLSSCLSARKSWPGQKRDTRPDQRIVLRCQSVTA